MVGRVGPRRRPDDVRSDRAECDPGRALGARVMFQGEGFVVARSDTMKGSPDRSAEPGIPHVGVVVPAHDAAAYLAETLDSIITQTHPPAEVVVVDDGSTDDTADIARSYPVRVLRQEQAGPGAARNAGVAATSAPLVAFCDADDVWLPDKLERQVAALEDPSGSDVDAVVGLVENFVSPDREGTVSAAHLDRRLVGAIPSALLIRRSLFDELGPFRTDDPMADWSEWWVRLSARPTPPVVVDALLVRRRIHGGNLTLQAADQRAAYLRLARASIARRRAPSPHGGSR